MINNQIYYSMKKKELKNLKWNRKKISKFNRKQVIGRGQTEGVYFRTILCCVVHMECGKKIDR